jgi:type III restriction enzyme
MRFQFDPNQAYQQRAVNSVADLFQGAVLRETGVAWVTEGMLAGERTTTSHTLDNTRLLANLHKVQEANKIAIDAELKPITETVDLRGEKAEVCFPNFSVEMETGTGKTYVYTRTALELNRRYGLNKFIIVVPSVAIREGVLKSFKMTEGHFAELFDNEPYRYEVYESRNLNRLRGFAEDEGLRFLIMTVDSFNREENVIRQSTDRLQGKIGLHMLQAVRPVLILDEPQNMASKARIKALASLNPLAALRYSATHREPYNLVYRLTPYEAYRQGLVKKIEVASVVRESDFNQVFVRLESIQAGKKAVTAKLAVHQRMAGGAIKEKTYTFRPGDKLADKAERSEYDSFVIDEINPGSRSVTFANGIVLQEGQAQGADEVALFREQIRYTVEAHLRRQEQLREQAIKVLSLFFIDRVDNYTAPDGLIRRLFEEAFNDLKAKFPAWANCKPEQVRGAYFAQKRRKGGAVEFRDSATGDNAEDRAAYALIMREKERLLSFSEPVSFIFSHSALREGWDNPNIFQICTLNQTTSEIKKRQEVGRGMRLARNQDGQRLKGEKINALTVVANESYEDFVKALQKEIAEDYGEEEAKKIRPVNVREKKKAIRKPLDEFPQEFKELWERIKLRTRYHVQVDTPALIAHVVDDLNLRVVAQPRIVVTKARVEAQASKDAFMALQLSGAKAVASLAGRFPLPNLVDKMTELLAHISPPVRLTRATLLAIIRAVEKQQAILDNPEEFAIVAVGVIRQKLEEELVRGIVYEKDGQWYEMELWEAEIETSSDKIMDASKSLYDRFVYQSETERKFAAKLESRNDVRFYVKLPAWFKVATPVGNYNPDWALVMEEVDQFGDVGERLYLVRETKGSTELHDLYLSEQQKIRCGERHFKGALAVDFKVVANADQLP